MSLPENILDQVAEVSLFSFAALFVANLKNCSRDSSLQEALSKFNPGENLLDFLFWYNF